MQTILITLDSTQMDNPDLDIRYLLPDRIDEYTEGAVRENDLRKAAVIYISEEDSAELEQCRRVYPGA